MTRPSDPCFVLRVKLRTNEPMIVIRAYDDMCPTRDSAGRIRLTCQVAQGGRIMFPKGQLYCALHGTSDGIQARELVMSLVAMKPGDTDQDYFSDYTEDQLNWALYNGESLSCERECRYCDQNGNVR